MLMVMMVAATIGPWVSRVQSCEGMVYLLERLEHFTEAQCLFPMASQRACWSTYQRYSKMRYPLVI